MNKFLQGYHGTSKENSTKILQSKRFIPAGSYRDWLGRGVYFFENDARQAYKFSKAKNHLSDNDIAVIEAEIVSREGQFLDLLTDEGRKFFDDYAQLLEDKMKELNEKIGGTWKHKEGYVADFINEDMPYDFIKAAYKVPKIKPHSIFDFEITQTQICVKNIDCIMKDSIKEVDCSDREGVSTKSLDAFKKYDR